MRTLQLFCPLSIAIILSFGGCSSFKAYSKNDYTCSHFDEIKRSTIKKRLNPYFSEFKSNHVLIEMGDTNYYDYDFLFFGLNQKKGLIITDSTYWKESSSKGYKSERIINVDVKKMANFFNKLHTIINNNVQNQKKSNVLDGGCYLVKINIRNRSTKFSVYSPKLFPPKGATLSQADVILSSIFRFFKNVEIENNRYIRKKIWLQKIHSSSIPWNNAILRTIGYTAMPPRATAARNPMLPSTPAPPTPTAPPWAAVSPMTPTVTRKAGPTTATAPEEPSSGTTDRKS